MRNYTAPGALQRVVDEVDRTACEMDRRFFRDHPGRSYWVRPAQPAEVAEFEIVAGKSLPLPPWSNHACVAVRQIAAGARLRLPFHAPHPAPLDLPEDTCRDLYSRLWSTAVATRGDHA